MNPLLFLLILFPANTLASPVLTDLDSPSTSQETADNNESLEVYEPYLDEPALEILGTKESEGSPDVYELDMDKQSKENCGTTDREGSSKDCNSPFDKLDIEMLMNVADRLPRLGMVYFRITCKRMRSLHPTIAELDVQEELAFLEKLRYHNGDDRLFEKEYLLRALSKEFRDVGEDVWREGLDRAHELRRVSLYTITFIDALCRSMHAKLPQDQSWTSQFSIIERRLESVRDRISFDIEYAKLANRLGREIAEQRRKFELGYNDDHRIDVYVALILIQGDAADKPAVQRAMAEGHFRKYINARMRHPDDSTRWELGTLDPVYKDMVKLLDTLHQARQKINSEILNAPLFDIELRMAQELHTLLRKEYQALSIVQIYSVNTIKIAFERARATHNLHLATCFEFSFAVDTLLKLHHSFLPKRFANMFEVKFLLQKWDIVTKLLQHHSFSKDMFKPALNVAVDARLRLASSRPTPQAVDSDSVINEYYDEAFKANHPSLIQAFKESGLVKKLLTEL